MENNVLELQKDIGDKVLVPAGSRGSMQVQVVIKNVRLCYGKKQWLVEPVAGYGQAWIDAHSEQIRSERGAA